MRILFLNTWHAKLEEPLSEFIKNHRESIDVFCLQETDAPARLLCRNLLNGFQELSCDKDLPDGNSFSQAIYVRPRITTSDSAVLLQEDPSAGLALHITLEQDGSKLSLCNVHGISFPKVDDKLDTPGRLEQSQAIIDFYQDSEIPVVIGGDFNMLPAAKSIGMFQESGYQNLISDYKIPTTRNHYAWDRYPKTPQDYADFIFTSRGIQTEAFAVAKDLVSDHQPLILTISTSVPAGAAKHI